MKNQPVVAKSIKVGTMLWLTFHQGVLHNKLLKVVKGNSGKCFKILDWVTYEDLGEYTYNIENYLGETYAYVCAPKQSLIKRLNIFIASVLGVK